jgi:hypothetical protein
MSTTSRSASTHYSDSHSDAVQNYIAKCRGTALPCPQGVPHVTENCTTNILTPTAKTLLPIHWVKQYIIFVKKSHPTLHNHRIISFCRDVDVPRILPGFNLPMSEADLKSIKPLLLPVSATILPLQVFFKELPAIVKQTPLI